LFLTNWGLAPLFSEIPFAYLVDSNKNEGAAAGSDSIEILPVTTTFPASSSQPWLTIVSTSNGAIDFAFEANPSVSARSAFISVVGENITVTQNGSVPAYVVPWSGSSQSVEVGHTLELEVRVLDATGAPVHGATVLFSAPTSGPGGTFGGSPTASVTTNSSGYATAALTANAVQGGPYNVVMTVSGVASPGIISITNVP
jgi:hypothetical protein